MTNNDHYHLPQTAFLDQVKLLLVDDSLSPFDIYIPPRRPWLLRSNPGDLHSLFTVSLLGLEQSQTNLPEKAMITRGKLLRQPIISFFRFTSVQCEAFVDYLLILLGSVGNTGTRPNKMDTEFSFVKTCVLEQTMSFFCYQQVRNSRIKNNPNLISHLSPICLDL